jgi:hypothetical protein
MFKEKAIYPSILSALRDFSVISNRRLDRRYGRFDRHNFGWVHRLLMVVAPRSLLPPHFRPAFIPA